MTAMLGAVQIVPPDIRIEPPGAAPFSMTSGRAPASTALAAAHSPAIPPPQTSTSTGSPGCGHDVIDRRAPRVDPLTADDAPPYIPLVDCILSTIVAQREGLA